MYLFRSPLVLRGTKVFSRLLVLTGVILALSAFVNGMPVSSSVNSTQMPLERRAGVVWELTITWNEPRVLSAAQEQDEYVQRTMDEIRETIGAEAEEEAGRDGDTVAETKLDKRTLPLFASDSAREAMIAGFVAEWKQKGGQGLFKSSTGILQSNGKCERCTALRPLPSSTSPTRPSRARPIGSKLPRPVSPPRTQHTPSSPPTTQQQIRLDGVFANCTPREGQRWKRKEEGKTGGTQRRGAEEENGGRHGEDEGEEKVTGTACIRKAILSED
ncbi:hypothetical protein EV360DRAFT_75963 [Lentinula raphanica]|nr:hypothetical protein EV360DRAFT_75963 [Lentinula raphanica]